MIKFFRKIRQSLLLEGNTAKYLKYAVGEILLVVIGILIALQINNWNEVRKELINETKILKTLNAEFTQNSITLDSILKQLNRMEQSLSFVFQNIKPDPNLDYTPEQLDSLLSISFSDPYWTRSEYTLRNLESSGKLSTLKSEDLKSKLYEWSLVATDISDKDSDATQGFNILLNYYRENGSLRNLDEGGWVITEGRSSLDYDHFKFFTDIVFENIIDDCLVYTRQRIRRYNKARIIIDQVIALTQTADNKDD
ncbi:DUF6090 family protein [Geojedonia litorea]|uniref:DUF6090 family protein n=1 Tax=Geojedonia litorea TaxID=1268269 RepID=A0ABV9N1U1_9FLAO